MKKLVQLIIVLALVFVLTAGAFLSTSGAVQTAGGRICPNVGWNTRVASCSPVAYQIRPPLEMPNVGWNG